MLFLDILFPRRCVGCGRIGSYFCSQCIPRMIRIAQHEQICPVCLRLAMDGITHVSCRSRYTPDGLTAFFRYGGVVRQALKSLKYRFVSDLAGQLSDLFPVRSFEKALSGYPYAVVPVPLHPARERERGFNQSSELAGSLAHILRYPVCGDMLARAVYTSPQASLLGARARAKNVRKAFAVRSPAVPPHILLVDDVFTTGATMREAAKALRKAGAVRVWLVAVAR